jgi:hypothetical protein
MIWFSASLLFSSERVGHVDAEPLWQERIILLQGDDETAAMGKAETIGKAEEHEYRNAENQLVRWRFTRVERICQIEHSTLGDGTELFSRFLRDSEARSLLRPFED